MDGQKIQRVTCNTVTAIYLNVHVIYPYVASSVASSSRCTVTTVESDNAPKLAAKCILNNTYTFQLFVVIYFLASACLPF